MLTAPTWKTWALRAVVFAAAAALGAFGAIAALWALVVIATFAFGDGDLFAMVFIHWGLIGPVALGCGAVVGMAAASGSTWGDRHQRGVLAGGALFVLFAVPMTAWAAWPEPAFDPAAFRQAMVAGNDDRVEIEAYRAADQGVLIGKSKEDIRALLGRPHQAARTHWRWNVGMIGDFLGPGDGGSLYVHFDLATERAKSAEVR